MIESIISEIKQKAIRSAAFTAIRKTEEAYEKGGSLHEIAFLKKNSFPTIFRSFLELEISRIAQEYEIVETSYDYIIATIDNLEFLMCSTNDLYRPKKNDKYDDLPLFTSCGLDIVSRPKSKNTKGFLVFMLYDYQLVKVSITSRTNDFPEILIYQKDRNSIIIDSLSVMRDTAIKDENFMVKKLIKKEGGEVK